MTIVSDFLKNCENNNLDDVKSTYKSIALEIDLAELVIDMCERGHIEIVKFLYPYLDLKNTLVGVLIVIAKDNCHTELLSWIIKQNENRITGM